MEERPLPGGELKVERKFLYKQNREMIKFRSLNKSEQFLKILKKHKINTKYFTIYFNKNSNNFEKETNKFLNMSFVTKKNVGNAVIRNKIKRKLKSAVQKISKEKKLINLDYTYVVFGKNDVYKDKFELVLGKVNETFKKINQIGK